MTTYRRIEQYGPVIAIRFRFEKAAGRLPMHTHEADQQHITIVTRGSAHLFGDGWSKTATIGETVEFHGEENTHEIVALEDDTEILNICKYTAPTSADQKSEWERILT